MDWMIGESRQTKDDGQTKRPKRPASGDQKTKQNEAVVAAYQFCLLWHFSILDANTPAAAKP